MRFEVLGPVRAVHDGQVLGPISDLRRRLLAVLLARANRSVPSDVLAEALWGAAVPQRPANSLHVHVHRLRQVLDRPDRLLSVPGGYLLSVGPDELDAQVFGRLHAHARRTATSGDLDAAVARFREALASWRDAPYADVDETRVVAPEAKRLAEARLVAYEELFDTELARGRAREVVPELTELVTAYPLRERFIGQQMLALYRSGRRTRAEVAYRAARQRLARDLSAEPGRDLRELGEAIRTEDPKLDHEPSPRPGPAGRVRPAQLPPAPGAFFGREPELAELERIATMDDGELILLTGMAGIGKTGLALRYAHRVADRFGDGQLYLDLGGHSSVPALDPLAAVGQLLRGLGAESKQGWESAAAATAEYRSVLNGRKVLVLLDNAASAKQVRPLLPATSGCLTVITSRNRLSGLVAREGAHRIGLGELPSSAAHALLVRLVGKERLDNEPEHAAALIKACAGLPLALRIAAAQLADEPHRPLADYLAELTEQGPTTLALDDDEYAAVSAAFDLSYQRLDPATRQVFRRLGLVPGLDFTVDVVAALSRTTPSAARNAVRRLTGAHLLEEHSPGRYRFHDLLRDDARSRAEAEDTAQARDDVLERLFAWYYQGKMAAVALLASTRRHPPAPRLPDAIPGITFENSHQATGWMQAEFPNIAAAIKVAGRRRDQAHWTWRLSIGLMLPMAERGYLTDIQVVADSATAAARAAGDQHALANVLTESIAARHRFDLPVDTDRLDEALRHAEQVGDHPLLAYCLNVAGYVHKAGGDLDVAERYVSRSLDIHSADADVAAQARAVANLGLIAAARGDLRLAEQRFEQILELPDTEDGRLTAIALPELIRMRVMLGRLDGMEALIERAEDAVTRSGHGPNTHKLPIVRSGWYRDTGRHGEAFEQASAAVRIAQELDQPWACSAAHYHLGHCRLTHGDIDGARAEFERAAEFADSGRVLESRSQAIRGLAETELAAGRLPEAEAQAIKALDVARSWRWDPVQLAGAVVTLGRVELALDRPDDAIGRGAEALTIHQRTGHFLGLARAHRLLGEAGSDREHLRQALRMFEAYGSPEAIEVQRLLGT